MTKTKKNLLVTAVAIMLAVVVLCGGATYTYLSSYTETVTNKFNTNEVDIDLEETTGEEYEIIPGTSEEKDPVVSGTFTVDSYLYVLVYGNNPTFTNSAGDEVTYIEWAEEDGWSVLDLSSITDPDEQDAILGYFGIDPADVDWDTDVITILYREVNGSDVEQEFHVLKGDKVTYNSEITSEMLSQYADGDIYLAFAGYAIQQNPFNSAYDALTQTLVTTASGLTNALTASGSVTLSGDISMTSTELATAIATASTVSSDVTIDLNGNTLTLTDGTTIEVPENSTLTFENGNVETTDYGTAASGLTVSNNSVLTLSNVEYEGASLSVLQGVDNATINVLNSKITGTNGYALSTNASTPASSNITINIDHSELTSVLNEVTGDPEVAAVLINIPATVTITESTITGGAQGLIMRGGTATITNTVITAAMTGYDTDATPFATTTSYYAGGRWGSGNAVPAAALVVGNNSDSSYAYDTSVTLSGVTLVVGEGTSTVPSIYVATSNGYSATVTGVEDSDTILCYVGSGSASVNGTALTSVITEMTTVKSLAD
ncbi:MAG: hypothetical protein LUH18_07995 [Oscillospiraceae bacterium]|nr:hypothetical protein [Oscillospiraceae bacterium]